MHDTTGLRRARGNFQTSHYHRPYDFGDQFSITLHTGRIVDGTVRAIIERANGKPLQMDHERDQTAPVELWRVHVK